MKDSAAERFARVVIAMQPYAAEIVFVGGWVHALYLAEANDHGAVVTEDIDLTLPRRLLTRDRPTLLDLAVDAGFERDPISDLEGVPAWMVFRNADGNAIPIDFLTEGEPTRPVAIVGQNGLLAQGYPGQQMLLDSCRWIEVGTALHPLLDPPRRIRVPTLGAYLVQKGIASAMRSHRAKAAKDLVYLYEILRHPMLGAFVVPEMRALRTLFPVEHARFRASLVAALSATATLRDVADQLIEAGRSYGTIDATAATVEVRFRRVLAECE